MRGEEKGINTASKAAHLAEGGFWQWVGGAGDFQTFGAAGEPVQSYQRRDSHHHSTRRAGKAIQDYADSVRIGRAW